MDFRVLKKANMAELEQKTLFTVDNLEFPWGIPKRSQTLPSVIYNIGPEHLMSF